MLIASLQLGVTVDLVRRLVLLLTVLASLVGSPVAMAEIVTTTDLAGRTITFDVQAESVDVEWYAALLRNAAHGAEIERVTFRIVTPEALAEICGGEALGCYGGRKESARIVLPTGDSPTLVHTLVHEYGHHVDAWRGVAAIEREPNGSATWAVARGIPELLAAGKVAHDYSLGWDRSIGEIFAEDYAQLHLETPFKITWLAPPSEAVRAALRNDLENVPAAPTPVASRPPVTIAKSGTLRSGLPSSSRSSSSGPVAASPSAPRSPPRRPRRGWSSAAPTDGAPRVSSAALAGTRRSTSGTSARPAAPSRCGARARSRPGTRPGPARRRSGRRVAPPRAPHLCDHLGA